MNPEIQDDFLLLKAMINDSRHQSSLYCPGPYWSMKIKNSVSEIKRCGIKDFRGSSNLIGVSYADNLVIDVRDAFNFGFGKIIRWMTKLYPFGIIYDAQVKQTQNYAAESIRLSQEILNQKPRVRELLRKYRIPYSHLGGCKTTVNIDGWDYAIHYLNVLDQHDNVAAHIRFHEVRTVFEIGGGFGTNIHLLIENYPKIKKVIYLDIPPNLYVGTQYLKAFYGKAVHDYGEHRKLQEIKFSDTDELEIFCIAPWQIERLQTQIDIFMNSHSFVEMPKETISNYTKYFMNLPQSEKSKIVLITYDNFDPTTTLDPDSLPQFFPSRKFQFFLSNILIEQSRKNLYYVSV